VLPPARLLPPTGLSISSSLPLSARLNLSFFHLPPVPFTLRRLSKRIPNPSRKRIFYPPPTSFLPPDGLFSLTHSAKFFPRSFQPILDHLFLPPVKVVSVDTESRSISSLIFAHWTSTADFSRMLGSFLTFVFTPSKRSVKSGWSFSRFPYPSYYAFLFSLLSACDHSFPYSLKNSPLRRDPPPSSFFSFPEAANPVSGLGKMGVPILVDRGSSPFVLANL